MLQILEMKHLRNRELLLLVEIKKTKKLGGLKTDNKVNGGFTFKDEKSKASDGDLGSYGNMYKSMIVS